VSQTALIDANRREVEPGAALGIELVVLQELAERVQGAAGRHRCTDMAQRPAGVVWIQHLEEIAEDGDVVRTGEWPCQHIGGKDTYPLGGAGVGEEPLGEVESRGQVGDGCADVRIVLGDRHGEAAGATADIDQRPEGGEVERLGEPDAAGVSGRIVPLIERVSHVVWEIRIVVVGERLPGPD
jgi:hypothetical protein